jgi:hypothetical protein
MVKVKIQVGKELLHLVHMYGTAKIHKTPPCFRYIASSRQCTTKPLSQMLTKCLKQIQAVHKKAGEREYRRTGVKSYWIVETTDDVLAQVQRVNDTHSAEDLSSYDFKTLYTKIPHDSLKQEMRRIIEEAYKVRKRKFLVVSN